MVLKVKQLKQESDQVLSLIFEKPDGFKFYPAQFIDLQLDINNPDNSRIFSLSTSPTEKDLMITFKKGISDYKKKLQTLKLGDEVTITHPNGTYTLDENSPAVMLAGGVGIAPHRSMIKFAVDQKLKTHLTLIYCNSGENFPFKKELDNWQKESASSFGRTKLDIHYIVTSKAGHLTKAKIEQLYPCLAGRQAITLYPIFYLAGPPSFVQTMVDILSELGVDPTNIRTDSFDGY